MARSGAAAEDVSEGHDSAVIFGFAEYVVAVAAVYLAGVPASAFTGMALGARGRADRRNLARRETGSAFCWCWAG